MRRWAEPAAYLGSAVLHGILFVAVVSAPAPTRRGDAVDVQITESRRPPPPAVAAPEPPPPERPPPREPPPPEPRPISRRLTNLPPAPEAPPRPPPPSSSAPPATPEGPVRIGISISSTVEAGAAATPVGDTLYGRAPEHAPEPGSALPYRSERSVPASEVTVLPEPIATEVPRSEYPDEAKRIGFEGAVRLRLTIDEAGRVVRAIVVEDPGHGLGAAAARAAERYFRFRPARRAGVTVSTEIPFVVHFELS